MTDTNRFKKYLIDSYNKHCCKTRYLKEKKIECKECTEIVNLLRDIVYI